MVIGDIDIKTALSTIYQEFNHLEAEPGVEIRPVIAEPVQEGVRRVEIKRPGTISLLALAAKHPGFPSAGWFTTMLALKVLAGNPNSILNQKLVDTGLVSNISTSLEPSKDTNLAILSFTLGAKITHAKLEEQVMAIVRSVTESDIKKQHKALIARTLSDELFNRDSSTDIAAELTEYVSSGDWTSYHCTKTILENITPKDIKKELERLFEPNNLTIGTYSSF